MIERPILFNGAMVRAVLAGTKTQTRRAVKWRGVDAGLSLSFSGLSAHAYSPGWVLESPSRTSHEWRCKPTPGPYGAPGDRLWVREAFRLLGESPEDTLDMFDRDDVQYRADRDESYIGRYRPSIHMPRRFCRLVLEVVAVRVERLHDISEADAIAEGCTNSLHLTGGRFANENYAHLWDTINGDGAWDANPWVWVVEFRRLP